MASPHRPRPLGEVLNRLIGAMGIENKLDDARIVEAWNEIAGAPIQAVTQRAWARNGILYVVLSSSTWRQELFLHRAAWRRRLNEKLEAPVVQEIVFR